MRKVTYIVNAIILGLLLTSCNNLTILEFKNKYDWGEGVATTTRFWDKSFYFEFTYKNIVYEVMQYEFPNQQIGYKYNIIFDKNSPKNNFIILYQNPIKPVPLRIHKTIGKIKSIEKSKNFIITKYKYSAVEFVGKDIWINNVEAFPLDYYDKLLKIKNEQTNVVVELYILNVYSGCTTKYRPFLNVGSTLL